MSCTGTTSGAGNAPATLARSTRHASDRDRLLDMAWRDEPQWLWQSLPLQAQQTNGTPVRVSAPCRADT